jgi:hypothetical protein
MNPELQRNLWLEASPRRIAWAGVTLALVYGAVALLGRQSPQGLFSGLPSVALLVFVLCAFFWAPRAAGDSVLAEVAGRTWDFQRLSALSPWAMTWGKLAGATSLAWLCTLTATAIIAVHEATATEPHGYWGLLNLLAIAVLLQAVSMGSALIGVRKARAEGRVARAGGVLGGLIVGIILLLGVAGSAGFQRGMGLRGVSEFLTGHGFIPWWGMYLPADQFRGLALAAFALWAVAGAWRLMRLELQMQNAPIVWPAFLIFLAVFVAGLPVRGSLAFGGEMSGGGLLAATLAVALCAYAAAFADPGDRVRLRSFGAAAAKRQWGRVAFSAPAALAPVILAIVLALLALIVSSSPRFGPSPQAWQACALIAFVLRDLGVIAFFRFGPRPQKGDFGAVVALALLYGVGGIVGRTVGQGYGPALFAPLPDAPLASLASGLAQAIIVWALASRRIGKAS